MCGIIGYVGDREAKPLLLQGLKRLEYRGYDSAGIALREDARLDYVRAVGNLQNLVDAAGPNGSSSHHGLGHTRWATHGGVTELNAHPLDRLRRRQDRHRPQRDRRELPRAEAGARRAGSHVHVGDRRRSGRAHARARVRRRSRRGARARLPAARGPLLDRRHPPRPSEPARRRAPPDAARRRRRRGRDVHRVVRRRVPQRDAPRQLPRRRRDRRDHAFRGALLRRRRRGRGPSRRGHRLGRRRRREGRLRDVHAEGDLRAAGGAARDDRRPRPRSRARARGSRDDRAGDPEPAPDRRSSPAAPRTTPASSGGT